MYKAKLKFYNDTEKTISVIFNEEQRYKDKWYFEGYDLYRTVTFKDYKNEKKLVKNIADYITKYYKEEQNYYTDECINWIKKRTEEVLLDEINSTSLTIYNNNIFSVGFQYYIANKMERKRNENK